MWIEALLLALIAAPASSVPESPVVVAVDGRMGKDVPGCGLQRKEAAISGAAPSVPCKTLRQGAKEGEAKARATNQSLKLVVIPGLYLGECSTHGIELTVPTEIMKSEGPGTITIDCESKGKAFTFIPATVSNSTLNSRLTLVLDGLTIQNAFSTTSGGAVYVECCALIVRGSRFEHARSLVKFGTSPYEGGGAIYVRKLLRLDVTDSSFLNCSTPNANGGAIWVAQAAGTYTVTQGQEKQNIVVARSQFHDNSAYAFGGSMGVTIAGSSVGTVWRAAIGEGGVRATSVLFDRCVFAGSSVKNKDTTISASGAGLYLLFDDEVSNAVNTFSRCNFTNSVVYSDGSKVVGADGNNNAEGTIDGNHCLLHPIPSRPFIDANPPHSSIATPSHRRRLLSDVSRQYDQCHDHHYKFPLREQPPPRQRLWLLRVWCWLYGVVPRGSRKECSA
jgi:hypothetical protein